MGARLGGISRDKTSLNNIVANKIVAYCCCPPHSSQPETRPPQTMVLPWGLECPQFIDDLNLQRTFKKDNGKYCVGSILKEAAIPVLVLIQLGFVCHSLQPNSCWMRPKGKSSFNWTPGGQVFRKNVLENRSLVPSRFPTGWIVMDGSPVPTDPGGGGVAWEEW